MVALTLDLAVANWAFELALLTSSHAIDCEVESSLNRLFHVGIFASYPLSKPRRTDIHKRTGYTVNGVRIRGFLN